MVNDVGIWSPPSGHIGAMRDNVIMKLEKDGRSTTCGTGCKPSKRLRLAEEVAFVNSSQPTSSRLMTITLG